MRLPKEFVLRISPPHSYSDLNFPSSLSYFSYYPLISPGLKIISEILFTGLKLHLHL